MERHVQIRCRRTVERKLLHVVDYSDDSESRTISVCNGYRLIPIFRAFSAG